MKNKQKGFIKILLILIILTIIIVVGTSFYKNKKNVDRYNEMMDRRQSEQRPNPPLGFLVPNNIPLEYKPDPVLTRFTEYSSRFSYKIEKLDESFSKRTYSISFYENAKENFEEYVKRETESKVQTLRVIKEFTHNGSKGVIIGEFLDDNFFKKYPLKPSSHFLAYDHKGRLLKIHATDDNEKFTPEALIDLLKNMTEAKN